MSTPEISVVIPSYNHAEYVGEAVASVLTEAAADLEVVVIDDGSTDASRERLTALADDPRVRVELQDNRGAHAALNRGCGLARGRLIFILNSDDAFHPDRIARLTARLDAAPNSALAGSFIEVIDGDGASLGVKRAWRTLPPWPPPTAGPLLSELGDARLALLETNWLSTTSNMAFPAALVREHGLQFLPLRYAHDWDFALAACRHGSVELVEEPLVRYRVHGANTIGEGADEGRAVMRFEIMWVVARHAAVLLRRSARRHSDLADLRNRLARSAPSFGHPEIFDQLLLLRGIDSTPPTEYDDLLDPDHPYRTAAVATLGDGSERVTGFHDRRTGR